MTDLTLYYKPTCPYCQKVLNFLTSQGISVPLKNTLDNKNREELINIGGKNQVPCLIIDRKALYESDDIIEWFKNNRL